MTQVLWLTYAPVATEAAEFYGVSTGAITALNLVYPLFYLVLAIPFGRLLDRSPRGVLLLAAGLTAVGGVVRVIGGDAYAAAMTGQLLVAIAQPILLGGLVVVARANLPAEQRPAGIAAGSVGFFLGILLGYTMPVLVDGDGGRNGLESLLALQAALGVAASAWMRWAVRRTTAAHPGGDVDRRALRAVLADPGVRVLAVLAIGGFGVFGALLGGAQPLLEPWGVSTDSADLLVDRMVLAGLVVSAFLPAVAARRGSQRRVLGVAAGAAGFAAAAVAVGGMLGSASDIVTFNASTMTSYDAYIDGWLLWFAFVVIGAALVPALPILLELAERRVPDLAGTVAAVIWLAGNLGVLVLTGVTSALYSEPAAAFGVLAATGVLTSAWALRKITPELTAPRRD